MPSNREVLRLIDANANRAAEGMRTVEDIARLVYENAAAARALKELRHALGSVLQHIPTIERLTARDTQSDAGTKTTLSTESSRSDWASIIVAACERTTQSLRCLEEFSKALPADVKNSVEGRFKALRYRAYDVLAQAQQELAVPMIAPDAQLYVLIDCGRELESFAQYTKNLVNAGVDILQIRDKAADGAKLLAYSQAAKHALSDTTAILIVNDRVDVALAAKADGVHVGQDDLPIAEVKHLVPSTMLIGVSTHNIDQARRAEAEGADYIGCGPTFPSQTKTFSEFPGTKFLRAVASEIRTPAFAIGGIHADNLDEVLETGCKRIAVSNVVHSAPNAVATALRLKKHLSTAGSQSPATDA